MQVLLNNPDWALGCLLLCIAACVAGWVVLRGTKVLSSLSQLRKRQQEIDLGLEKYVNQAAQISRNKITKDRSTRSDVGAKTSAVGPKNLKKNWRWLVVGFAFVALGVLSLVTPHALDAFEFAGRRRGLGMLLQVLWGWPIGLASLVFGMICVIGSFMPMNE